MYTKSILDQSVSTIVILAKHLLLKKVNTVKDAKGKNLVVTVHNIKGVLTILTTIASG